MRLTSRALRMVALAAVAPRYRLNDVRRALSCRAAHPSASEALPDAHASGSVSVPLRSVADTLALGAALAESTVAGDVVLLSGDYGAGKTCLARGFLRHWYGDEDEQVTSPSYLIDNVYPDDDGRALRTGVTVHHMDLWRLPEGKITQLVDLPHVFTDCVSLIEWPERLGDNMPAEHLTVSLTIDDDEQGGGQPAVEITGGEKRHAIQGDGELYDDDDDAFDDDDDDAFDDDDEQPRTATIAATGPGWEARLPVLAERLLAQQRSLGQS